MNIVTTLVMKKDKGRNNEGLVWNLGTDILSPYSSRGFIIFLKVGNQEQSPVSARLVCTPSMPLTLLIEKTAIEQRLGWR